MKKKSENEKTLTSAAKAKPVGRQCLECRGRMAFRSYLHIEKVGKYTVKNPTGLVWQCDKCAEVDLSLDELARLQRQAAAITIRDVQHVDGLVVRYARRAMGLTQVQLASVLRCAPETLSRVENDKDEMSRSNCLALVALLEGLDRNGGGIDELLERELGERASVREIEVPPPVNRTRYG